jgi:hypothetical protein
MKFTACTRAATALALALLTVACATESDTYSKKLEQIPTPTTDLQRQQTCAWLHGEMERQRLTVAQSDDSTMPDLYGAITRAGARNRLAMLQTRWDVYNCDKVSLAGVTPPAGAPWTWNSPGPAAPSAAAPVPATPAAAAPPTAMPSQSYMSAPSPIERCISTCKSSTSKTPEQCFDSCNQFTSCLSACKANTSRSPEQCFDACNR